MFIFQLNWFSSSNNHWTYTLATERTVTESSTQMVEVSSLWDHGTAKFASLTVSQERNMVQWSQVMQGQSGVSTCVRRKALSSVAAMTLASGELCIIDIIEEKSNLKQMAVSSGFLCLFRVVCLFLSLEEKELETSGVIFRIFMFLLSVVYICLSLEEKKKRKKDLKLKALSAWFLFLFSVVYMYIFLSLEVKEFETDGIIFRTFMFLFYVYIYPKNEW